MNTVIILIINMTNLSNIYWRHEMVFLLGEAHNVRPNAIIEATPCTTTKLFCMKPQPLSTHTQVLCLLSGCSRL